MVRSAASHLDLLNASRNSTINVMPDENSPHQESLNSENIDELYTISPRMLHSKTQSSANIGPLRHNGPVPLVADVNKSSKPIITNMLRNDPERLNLNVLKDFSTNVEKNSRSIRSSISFKESSGYPVKDFVEHAVIDTAKETPQLLNDEARSYYEDTVEEPGSTLIDICDLQDEMNTLNLKNADLKSSQVPYLYEDDVLSFDETFSYLNPYEPYVRVVPPMLGNPLAPNGTPLDLSSVEKRPKVGPLFEFEHPEVTDDEQKLLSVLDYELKKVGGSLNYDFSVADDAGSEMEGFDELGKPSNRLSSLFHRLFKLGIHSKDYKYSEKYPWYRIMYRVDHPFVDKENVNPANLVGQFERNNLDMFPDGKAFTPRPNGDVPKHAIHYVATRK